MFGACLCVAKNHEFPHPYVTPTLTDAGPVVYERRFERAADRSRISTALRAG